MTPAQYLIRQRRRVPRLPHEFAQTERGRDGLLENGARVVDCARERGVAVQQRDRLAGLGHAVDALVALAGILRIQAET